MTQPTTISTIPVLSIPLTGGVVQGIPQLDQLHEPTLDGKAPENASDDCVFTCNAMLSRLYRPDLNADGDAIKDSIPAYGQGYVGFSSQDTIIASGVLEQRWGTHSWRLGARGGSRDNLLADMTGLANAGTPSICTIPSRWGTQPTLPGYDPDHPNFYTHAVVYCGQLPDGRHVLANPWGGFLMYYTSAELALRLCFLCAYPVTRADSKGVTQVAWTKQPDKTGRDAAGHTCGEGFINDLLATGLAQHDGRLSETYVSGAQGFRSFLPLTSGDVLVYDGRSVTHDGALVAAELYRLLTVAQATPAPAPAPAPVPVDPKAQAAIALADAQVKYEAALTAYAKL